ncbi:unnamed protein product [Lactuca saligna]|uniref:Uncharacterized protein n=1 Tax=Lactuca saligna TaxID=75948 RepID=A0AA35Z4N4_LACSI|nr:unnamed protein product [Lactuca saligna]
MLNRFEGVLESGTLPKQERDTGKPSIKETLKPADTIENPELKVEPKAHKARIDEHNLIVREAEEKEKALCDAQTALEAKKLLFPHWSIERILIEKIDNPRIHWLEPVPSFDLEITPDLQLEFPVTLKAFLFRNFDQLTWSAMKITVVKDIGPIETESFVNAMFKDARGSECSVFEFSLADLPCLNPYAWITFLHFLNKEEKKYEPIVAHIKRMLVSYIYEVAKKDG